MQSFGQFEQAMGDGDDRVFVKPRAVANPLIARWRFLQRLAEIREPGNDDDSPAGALIERNTVTITFKTFRRTTAWRVLRSTTVDAALGAIFGGLCGLAVGGFWHLIQGDARQLAVTAGYFALCGAAGAALVGACGAAWNSRTTPMRTSDSTPPGVRPAQSGIQAISHIMETRALQPGTTLNASAKSDRQRLLAAAS